METSSPEVENGIYLVTIEISQEWKKNFLEVEKGIYLVDGNSWDFPGSGKSYLPVNR